MPHAEINVLHMVICYDLCMTMPYCIAVRGAPDPELCYLARSGSMPDPDMSDPAGSGSEPDPDILDPAGSGSEPDPAISPDIRPDPDLDPVHP